MSTITARLEEVRSRIARATATAGRAPGSVTLVAVSKTHPPEAIREAYAAGQRIFGENYVQELTDKAAALADLADLELHFIGHLQRNKVKDVLRVRALVETVDSERLGEEIAKRADALGARAPILVQVNVAREPQKAGCDPDAVRALLSRLRGLGALEIRGLMTIPPQTDHPASHAPWSRATQQPATAQLRPVACSPAVISATLWAPIAEGATHVRVGTAIFGARG